MATLDAKFCSPEERLNSASSNFTLHCLTRNESIALSFLTQSGALSLFACVTAFILIIRNMRYHARMVPGKWRLIKSPMDIYLLSLFLAETFAATGACIHATWVQRGKSVGGTLCVAQGIIFTIGNITIAASTLAIAVHTFIMVWCNKGFNALKAAWIAISIPWIYSVFYVTILRLLYRDPSNVVFRPSPYWCWIGKQYLVYRLLGGFLWMWISLFTSCLLYIPLFLWGRGNLTIGDDLWSFKLHKRRRVHDPHGLRRHALIMIAYPVLYGIQILPLSIVRWMGFVQETHGDRKNHVPPAAVISVAVIYNLSGITNIIVFLLTRRGLLLFGKDDEDSRVNEMFTVSDGEKVNTSRADVDSIEGHHRDDWREYINRHN